MGSHGPRTFKSNIMGPEFGSLIKEDKMVRDGVNLSVIFSCLHELDL